MHVLSVDKGQGTTDCRGIRSQSFISLGISENEPIEASEVFTWCNMRFAVSRYMPNRWVENGRASIQLEHYGVDGQVWSVYGNN